MKYEQIKEESMKLYPAFLLDKVISRDRRRWLRRSLMLVMLVSLCATWLDFFNVEAIIIPEFFKTYNYPLRGLTMILISLWVYLCLLESMYLSFYLRKSNVDFAVARHFVSNKKGDILKSFLESPTGIYTMKRLGIAPVQIKSFLNRRNISLPKENFNIPDEMIHGKLGVLEFIHTITQVDREFAYFLFENGVGEGVLDGALHWVAFQRDIDLRKGRWLSKESLIKIPSIGRQWSYGHTPNLDDYANEVYREDVGISQPFLNHLYEDDVNLVVDSMLSDRDPHTLFVSEDSSYSNGVIDTLVRGIYLGTLHPIFENSRVFKINGNLLFEELGNMFDQTFSNMTTEILSAGNIIPVFEHSSQFAELLHRQGKDFEILLQPFFESGVPIILLSDTRGYHHTLQTYSILGRYMNVIEAEPKTDEQIINRIQDEIIKIETKTKLFFTYTSIETLVYNIKKLHGKDQITETVLDTLYKILPQLNGNKLKLVTKNAVLELVERQFNVPQTLTHEGEKESLLKLEEKMSERVMGQELAINAIADTLRRVRTGLGELNRPLGTFLFVGPTGVGKTETAKTLAASYFGSEENLMRVDMSEFSGSDALNVLIGDEFNGGRLRDVVGENPYGVLLLDEFEKAHKDVHNLFLQIIDEGYVTDGRGHEINMRNIIIIATSNAGSDMWQNPEFVEKNHEDRKQELIDHIIVMHILSPELINRFDYTVLFEPLADGAVSLIARKELGLLAKRLEQQGIGLEINNFLVSFLVSKGMSIQFGAREMQRVIKDSIESRVAKEILKENLKAGSMITFEPSETGEEFDIKISNPTILA